MSDNPPTASGPAAPTADFGFRAVPREAKTGMVRAVFDSVAPALRRDERPDVARHPPRLEAGLHHAGGAAARRALCSTSRAARATSRSAGSKAAAGSAILSDINARMLTVGRDRAITRGLDCRPFAAGDRRRTPATCPTGRWIPSRIAFGLRNCTDKDAVLAEARRVLRPGGRFLCLEFSRLQRRRHGTGLRRLVLQGAAAARPNGRGRCGELSVSWPRASAPSLIRKNSQRCFAMPGCRASCCASCRAASRRSTRAGGCEADKSHRRGKPSPALRERAGPIAKATGG